MDATLGVSCVFLGVFYLTNLAKSQEQCSGELWCEQGHCCGEDGTHCCTYYYELWWFWMIWGLIIMLSCCCLYQQHRLKKRQRRALRALQTGLQESGFVRLPALSTGPPGFGSDSYTESELRLPTYDEVQDLPKDPPAYEQLFEGHGQQVPPSAAGDSVSLANNAHPPQAPDVRINAADLNIDESDSIGLLENEAVPIGESPPAYSLTAS